jgi:NADPH-dependent F420 reductase
MEIGILGGTGHEGKGLALRLGLAGFSVKIGSRIRSQALRKAQELQRELKIHGSTVHFYGQENCEIVKTSELIFLAVPFERATGLLRECRPFFREGQILVDVTVPLQFRDKRVELRKLAEASGSEHLVKSLPNNVALVAAFKTIPAHLLANLEAQLDCHVFVCGDLQQANYQVVQLISKIKGLSALDVGSLREARTLEHMCALAIQINKKYRVHSSRFRLLDF